MTGMDDLAVGARANQPYHFILVCNDLPQGIDVFVLCGGGRASYLAYQVAAICMALFFSWWRLKGIHLFYFKLSKIWKLIAFIQTILCL